VQAQTRVGLGLHLRFMHPKAWDEYLERKFAGEFVISGDINRRKEKDKGRISVARQGMEVAKIDGNYP
jgi:hypothetical protein